MPDTTYYTSCLRIERVDGFIICMTNLDKDLSINDTEIDLSAGEQTYLSAAGYTPTNMQSTSDNAVNNADVEGLLSAVGVQREDIVGGRYDFARLHMFLWDWKNDVLIKKLGTGHWGEVTIKDGSYVAEFRSLSQQLQQTIGRTYNPECDEQLGGPRCGISLGSFPLSSSAENPVVLGSKISFIDTALTEEDDYWIGSIINWWGTGNNPNEISEVADFVQSTNTVTLVESLPNDILNGDQYSITRSFLGTVTGSGTTTTFHDTNRTETGTTFIGLLIRFLSGSNNGLDRTITGFSSFEFTIDSPVNVAILSGDAYQIYDSRTGLIVDSESLTNSVIYDTAVGATDYSGMHVQFRTGDNTGSIRVVSSPNVIDELHFDTPFDHSIRNEDRYIIIDMAGDPYMSFGEVESITDSSTFVCLDLINSPFDDDYFNYGKLIFKSGLNNEIHMEVKDFNGATGEFNLFLPMPFEIAVGDSFWAYAGCDKRLETCRDKFLNNINFQGFPYIPGVDQISKFGGQ